MSLYSKVRACFKRESPAETPRESPSETPGESPSSPQLQSVKLAVLMFLAFCVFAAITVAKPSNTVLLACGIPFGIAYILFVVWIIVNYVRDRRLSLDEQKYSRNRTATTIIAILVAPALTALYIFSWKGKLNHVVLEITQDDVPYLPSRGVAARARRWLNETSAACSSLRPEERVPGLSCNCSQDWTPNVQENFAWQNKMYRYLSFQPPLDMIGTSPSYMLVLQAFFYFNTSRSLDVTSQTATPSLWMVVFDRDLYLEEALQTKHATLINIDANAVVFVNLGALRHVYLDAKPAYEYTVSLSTNPNLELVCNTSPQVQSSWPCHVSLFLQFPTFQRQIITERKEMAWTDVLANAGAYFALIQLLSWLVSGQAIGA